MSLKQKEAGEICFLAPEIDLHSKLVKGTIIVYKYILVLYWMPKFRWLLLQN